MWLFPTHILTPTICTRLECLNKAGGGEGGSERMQMEATDAHFHNEKSLRPPSLSPPHPPHPPQNITELTS